MGGGLTEFSGWAVAPFGVGNGAMVGDGAGGCTVVPGMGGLPGLFALFPTAGVGEGFGVAAGVPLDCGPGPAVGIGVAPGAGSPVCAGVGAAVGTGVAPGFGEAAGALAPVTPGIGIPPGGGLDFAVAGAAEGAGDGAGVEAAV